MFSPSVPPPNSSDISLSSLRDAIVRTLNCEIGTSWEDASIADVSRALGLVLREPLLARAWATEQRRRSSKAKSVAYLSLEFLVGRSLRANLHSLGLIEPVEAILGEKGTSLNELLDEEAEPALGNGGLGRLAACFLDSLATLSLPATGYGILYDYGLFRQEIRQGRQLEFPDRWDWHNSPWLVGRAEELVWVPLYGRIEGGTDREGNYNPMWVDWRVIAGVPHDLPIAGYGVETVQFLRLYAARASQDFDITIFNTGDYLRAVEQKIRSESVSKVLYPADDAPQGRELRLVQEYFLVACAVRDLFRLHQAAGEPVDTIADRIALQMNDTHPALAVAELMRMLVDENSVDWDRAWGWTQQICGYTNHTLMSEALETWPVELMERVLPRHLQVIYEINSRFLKDVRLRWPGDEARIQRVSIIAEDHGRRVRMANLAVVGSHAVNGVSALHSELVAKSLMPDFAEMWPERFQNKTNGISHRRWLHQANVPLSDLITSVIGEGWVGNPAQLALLRGHSADASLGQDFLRAKRTAQEGLALHALKKWGLRLDPAMQFDVQVKRIHQYKRQLLNAMAILYEYLRIVEDGWRPPAPRFSLFAGKAAPGYFLAKLIIQFINAMSDEIRGNPVASEWMQVAFLPDYRVSLAERIIPAADISEQISTAGTEASGTGNMKLALNGALTIGTLDGANIEIRDSVGASNFYLFGLTTPEVQALKANSAYRPSEIRAGSEAARRVVDAMSGRRLGGCDTELFRPLVEEVLSPADPYVHLADLDSYLRVREQALADYRDPARWAERAILNIAGMGVFSSDRTIGEYATDIWNIRPLT